MSLAQWHRPQSAALGALLAAVAAAAVFLVIRRDVVLADDWLLFSYFRDPATRRDLDWSLIVADLWTPWLTNDWSYFRPSSSLFMGAWMSLFGATPGSWHLSNIGLHAVDVGLFVLLLRRVGMTAAASLVAAALVVLHPANGEPVLWFGSVNELVAVFGTLLASLGVCRHRAGRRGGSALWTLGVWIALTGKENGIVVLLLLPLVDRLLGPRALGALVRDHLLHSGPVLALVLALRAAAGCLDPTAGFEGLDHSASHFVDSLVTKLGLVLMPGAPLSPAAAAVVAVCLLLAAGCGSRSLMVRVLGTLLVLGAYLACGTYHSVSADYTGSRMLYPTVFLAAAAVGWLVGATMDRRVVWVRRIAIGLVLLLSARALWQRGTEFQAAATAADRMTASLRTTYRALPATELLCPLIFPEVLHGTRAFLANGLFPIVEGEVAGANRLLPLTYLTSIVYVSRKEMLRALPLRAAVELGATLLLMAEDGTPTLLPAALMRGPATVSTSALRPDAQGCVRWPEPVSPFRIESVAVTGARAKTVELRWLPVGGTATPSAGRHVLAEGVARIQVGDDAMLMSGLTGGIAGLQLRFDGREPTAVDFETTQVEVSSDPERLAATPHPERAARSELARALVAPAVTLAPGMQLRMGMLLPSSGVSFEVRPGAPVELPPDVAHHLDGTLRAAPEITMGFWFYEQRERDDGEPVGGRRTPAARLVVHR